MQRQITAPFFAIASYQVFSEVPVNITCWEELSHLLMKCTDCRSSHTSFNVKCSLNKDLPQLEEQLLSQKMFRILASHQDIAICVRSYLISKVYFIQKYQGGLKA